MNRYFIISVIATIATASSYAEAAPGRNPSNGHYYALSSDLGYLI